MIIAQRGGYYYSRKAVNLNNGGRRVYEIYMAITPEIKVKMYAMREIVFGKEYNKKKEKLTWFVKRPFKDADPEKMPRNHIFTKQINKHEAVTVWDWAAVFLFETKMGCNQYSRELSEKLLDKDFLRIAKNIDMADWCGLHFKDITLFNGLSNELAREAHYHAASNGFIKAPHLASFDLINKNPQGIF